MPATTLGKFTLELWHFSSNVLSAPLNTLKVNGTNVSLFAGNSNTWQRASIGGIAADANNNITLTGNTNSTTDFDMALIHP